MRHLVHVDRRGAQPLLLPLLMVLMLLAAACGGDEATSDVDDTAALVDEADDSLDEGADDDLGDEADSADDDATGEGEGEADDDAMADEDDTADIEPLDFGEDTNVALFDCLDGDDFACELAYDYMGEDGLREVAIACDDGDTFMCDAFDRIVSTVGEDAGETEDSGAADDTGDDGYGGGSADDAGDQAAAAGDARGFVVARADGLEVTDRSLFFGADADDAVTAITAELGGPTDDTGTQPAGGGSGCGSDYRYVSWGDELTLTILDDSPVATGYPHVAAWQHAGGERVFAEAFVGDSTTVPISPGLSTVSELRDQLGESVEVYDEPPLGPTFLITDNLGEMIGELTDIEDDGIVQTINAGQGCGE